MIFNLESPANLKITNGVLSWDSVEEADHYLVFIDQTEVKVSLTYDLKNKALAVGSYTVSVVAVKDDKLSLPSNVLTYVVVDPAAEVVEVPKTLKSLQVSCHGMQLLVQPLILFTLGQ